MTETAGQEWRAYIDRHFEPEADNAGRTVGDRFPTTHELRVAKEAVLEDIPLNLRVLVEGDDDTGSVPILTVGDAFRSKRAKIHEFNYRKMGQPIPSTRDSFFKKQRTIIEGNNRDTLSQGSVASGSSVVSGASGPLKRKRAPSGSPSIDRVSIASQRSNSIAPLGPGTGPNVAYRSAESHCSDILEKTDDLIGKIESRDFEKTKHYAAKIVNHLVAKRIVDSKFTASKYCFDSVRHTFDETAQRKNVLSALHRCKEALRKRVPRGVSMATVRPIILVPSAIQSVINLYNAKALLSEGLWVDPIQAEKRSQVSAGNDVMFVNRAKCPFREFLIRDSAEKIKPEEWDYVCCVFVLGPAWQFKGFFGDKSEPRDVLDKIPGFNIQYDDEELHPNVVKWNIMSLRLSKTMNRRHKDIKTIEDFWRALLQRMPFNEKLSPFFRE